MPNLKISDLSVPVFTLENDDCEGVNLDDVPQDALQEFVRAVVRDPMGATSLVFPAALRGCEDVEARVEILDAMITLARYADVKWRASRLRLEGRVAEASVLEDRCDAIYAALPKFARW